MADGPNSEGKPLLSTAVCPAYNSDTLLLPLGASQVTFCCVECPVRLLGTASDQRAPKSGKIRALVAESDLAQAQMECPDRLANIRPAERGQIIDQKQAIGAETARLALGSNTPFTHFNDAGYIEAG